MNIFELDESLRTENPCWKGYKPVGTKKKNGRTVPNCVPKESIDNTSGAVINNESLEYSRINDDDWYEIDDQGKVYKQSGPSSYRPTFGTREIKLDNGHKVVRGMTLKSILLKQSKDQGVAEAINPDITNPAFSHQQQIGDYLYVARYWSKGLKITAYDGNKKIGYAELMYQSAPFDDFADPKTTPKRIWLESEWTRVDPKYQRQGIMSTMYAYAKMLGNSVKPSQTRSDDAKAAWKSWRDAGDVKYLTQSVAEGLNEMDKTQTPPGRDGGIDWTKKQIHLGPEHVIKTKDVAKHALKVLNKTMKKSHADTAKKKDVAEGSLNEFDAGEGGFGPFKLYKGDRYHMYHIDTFNSLDDAEEELEFQKDLAAKEGSVDYYKIVDGTGEEVGGFDPDEAYDAMTGASKIQYRKPGDQGVAEGSNDTVYPNATVIKSKNGRPVGEIYQDGNSWGCFHYRADRGYDMIDTREEAIEALKDLHQETGRSRPDYTIKGVVEGSEQKMSVQDTLAYLKKVMGTESHEDWRNHIINTNEYFVLKDISVNSLKSDLSGLNKTNVEKYKQMDFSKAPPIVIGSDGNILDGYHRANVAKALKVPTLKAWVGVKKQGVAEAFGPLPRKKQQIRLGRHTVDIERVGLDNNYISFAWHDSQGQEHYEEVSVGDLGSYDDLIDRIKDEIRYQERQYTDQGVAEGSNAPYWRVEQSDATGRYYVVTGYTDKSRKVWKNKLGAADFNKKENAEAKANELNQGMAEGDNEKISGRYNPDDFDAMVRRLGQRAKQGPLKTVYDTEKRVYKNVPVNKDKDVDEASLATMRDYFAGNLDAQDPTKVAQMRKYFAKQGIAPSANKQKEFHGRGEYQQWLDRNKLKPAGVRESSAIDSGKTISESLLNEFQTFLNND